MNADVIVADTPGAALDDSWADTLDRLRAFVAARVDDRELAADITQDVIVRSIASGALERVDNPAAWLYRSARNAVIDHYRTRRTHASLDEPRRLARTGRRRRPAQRRDPRAVALPAADARPTLRQRHATRSCASTSTARPSSARRRQLGHVRVRDEVAGADALAATSRTCSNSAARSNSTRRGAHRRLPPHRQRRVAATPPHRPAAADRRAARQRRVEMPSRSCCSRLVKRWAASHSRSRWRRSAGSSCVLVRLAGVKDPAVVQQLHVAGLEVHLDVERSGRWRSTRAAPSPPTAHRSAGARRRGVGRRGCTSRCRRCAARRRGR